MKWPKRLPAGGTSIPVRRVKEPFPGDTDKGEFVHENQPEPAIFVRDDLTERFADHVLCHEIVHAWFYMTGLTELLDLEFETEEAICQILASNLQPLLEVMIRANKRGTHEPSM